MPFKVNKKKKEDKTSPISLTTKGVHTEKTQRASNKDGDRKHEFYFKMRLEVVVVWAIKKRTDKNGPILIRPR